MGSRKSFTANFNRPAGNPNLRKFGIYRSMLSGLALKSSGPVLDENQGGTFRDSLPFAWRD